MLSPTIRETSATRAPAPSSTAAHGGNVTDPALSGSGVTAQDFRIPGRGSFLAYDINLDTSHASVLHDQAVHIAYLFDRNNFNTGVTLPITGTILNYADPGFVLDSGPGTLSHAGSSWTLDLGSIDRDPTCRRLSFPSSISRVPRRTILVVNSTFRARASQ